MCICNVCFFLCNGGDKILYLYSSVSIDIWKSTFVYMERYKKKKLISNEEVRKWGVWKHR